MGDQGSSCHQEEGQARQPVLLLEEEANSSSSSSSGSEGSLHSLNGSTGFKPGASRWCSTCFLTVLLQKLLHAPPE